MTLTNLIDLIAEVAAKRATEEGRTKEETPSAGLTICRLFWAKLWRTRSDRISFSALPQNRH
ncbi:hypothetical protein GLP59_00745 [Sulfitobacter sp. M220]|jgi:hypothetical protein|uniref:hypothetical protein n=1 Tax=Roseobacteraceae TaxID=2854170 RepID=UPI001EF132EF|nr:MULTISPECIES: hypothetical protein [unclassified Sulfitobacter]MCF7727723.1 hypothetical protein [Sulfitobacter sp. M22]MCF7776200.1 hypothetical protein [Sulfitobacter sp. M220]